MTFYTCFIMKIMGFVYAISQLLIVLINWPSGKVFWQLGRVLVAVTVVER